LRKNAIYLIFISLIGSVIGFFRETITAKYFGVSNEIENFIIASTLSIIIIPRISKAIISSFIPLYIKNEKLDEGSIFSNNIYKFIKTKTLYCIFLLITICFVAIICGYVFEISNYVVIGTYTLILIPSIYYLIISSVYSSILNLNNNFITPAITNFLLNIFYITFIYLSVLFDDLIYLPIGIVLHSYCQNYLLKRKLKKYFVFKGSHSSKYQKHSKDFNSYLKPAFLSAIAPIIPIILMRYLNIFYDSGDIVAFNYANLIAGLIPMLFSISVLTILTPNFSKWYHENKVFKEKINIVFIFISAITLPLQLFLFKFADKLINIFFLNGEFDIKASIVTSDILAILSLGIVVRIYREVLIRYSLAIGSTDSALKNTFNYMVLSVILTLVGSFMFGIKGAVFGIVIVEFYNAISFLWKIKDNLNLQELIRYMFMPVVLNILLTIAIKKMNYIDSLLCIAASLFVTIGIGLYMYLNLKRRLHA